MKRIVKRTHQLKKEFNTVKKFFPNAIVEFTTRGNIKIANPDNPVTVDYNTWYGKKPYTCAKWYVIGHNYNGWWIRRVRYSIYGRRGGVSCFPLKYDRNTGHYCFNSFDDALAYFTNLVINKKIDF